jgi:DNA-binding NarL/FixJ family response regulator
MTQATAAATILIVDDHPLYRAGIRALLSAETDLSACGEAGTIAEARAQLDALRPDLVILDLGLPDGDGITLLEELRDRPDPPHVLLVTVRNDDDPVALDALRIGAAGFVNKRVFGDELLTIIRAVLAGRTYISPEMIERLLRRRQ